MNNIGGHKLAANTDAMATSIQSNTRLTIKLTI